MKIVDHFRDTSQEQKSLFYFMKRVAPKVFVNEVLEKLPIQDRIDACKWIGSQSMAVERYFHRGEERQVQAFVDGWLREVYQLLSEKTSNKKGWNTYMTRVFMVNLKRN